MSDVIFEGFRGKADGCWSPDQSIKTEILDEIENFSMDDELNVEEYTEVDPKEIIALDDSNSDESPFIGFPWKRTGLVPCEINLQEYAKAEERKRPLECSICRVHFSRETEFDAHMINRHSHGKLFQCAVCKKQFSRCLQFPGKREFPKTQVFTEKLKKSAALRNHLSTHAEDNPKVRDSPFGERDTPKTRVVATQGRRKPFECHVCNKRLIRRQSLKDHTLMHTNVKPFECSACKKRFLRLSSLRAHMIVHTAEAPYQCEICAAKFKRFSILKTHQLTHSNERRYECEICKYRFRLKGGLKHHVLSHYGERPYACPQCDKRYRRSWGLKIHMCRHTGVRRFECDLCKSRFSVKTRLANHIYGHLGEKPYKCKRCGRQYGERYLLKGHKCASSAASTKSALT